MLIKILLNWLNKNIIIIMDRCYNLKPTILKILTTRVLDMTLKNLMMRLQ